MKDDAAVAAMKDERGARTPELLSFFILHSSSFILHALS
jgi:hypothetical protein